MQSRLEALKSKVKGNNQEGSITTEFFILAKELGCLPELIGREYEFIYEGNKLVGMRQKPMKTSSFIVLMEELVQYNKQKEKEMKKSRRRR